MTKEILKFRAHDLKLNKKVFELKPGEEIELGTESKLGGLELVRKGEKKKKKGDV